MDPAQDRRRFFLADPLAESPSLRPEEERHAAKVIRLEPGDRILGLDGQGGLHPLVLRKSVRGKLEFERDGEPLREPPPGSAGSPIGWIEVAVPLPKGARAEAMLERLTQLGIAALRPLDCARNQGFERESAESRGPRLERACLEACKQSRRSWMPKIHPTARPEDLRGLLAGRRCALLSPGAERTLLHWSEAQDAGPTVVIAGPEGGFTDQELASLDFATPLVLAPHILRIETAVEAAVSTLVQVSYARGLRSG
ncbi:MAG TPA: RsmE family RNA methyltransferase [Planctomycetota bacterium]|nr:RsmE family RNA methyltransferase [Planctomycetota bacterium]